MRILVVHGQKLEHYPPVLSLLEVLTRSGHKVTIITKCEDEPKVTNLNYLTVIRLPENNNQRNFINAIKYFYKKRIMRALVNREMKNNEFLWTTTDSTVRDLGKTVLKYKHILQLMELIEDMPAIPGLRYPRLNIKRYAKRAYKVVVPEYNRAHIQKAWWGLCKTPDVLPNKMSFNQVEDIPDTVNKVLQELNKEKRKILLYQGSFGKDRDLELFSEAVKEVGEQYVLYLMGPDSEERRALCAKNKQIKYIPFVKPPYHLCISQRAHIGLLPYVSSKVGFNSVLNALYCAPNKVFEFSGFGIPMLGNDVPGLTIPFERYNIGKVRRERSIKEIIHLIEQIDREYEIMSVNCRQFYNSFDLDAIVNGILE